MSLILAIEPDPRQASQLADLVRGRLSADLVHADTTEGALMALAGIGDRVPDLVLVPSLLSAQEDAAIAGALRMIATAANVRMLTIPKLADPEQPPVRRGVFARFRGGAAKRTVGGCDPAVFAEQISGYLAEAAAERRAQEADDSSSDSPAPAAIVASAVEPVAPLAAHEEASLEADAPAANSLVEVIAPDDVIATDVSIISGAGEAYEPWNIAPMAAASPLLYPAESWPDHTEAAGEMTEPRVQEWADAGSPGDLIVLNPDVDFARDRQYVTEDDPPSADEAAAVLEVVAEPFASFDAGPAVSVHVDSEPDAPTEVVAVPRRSHEEIDIAALLAPLLSEMAARRLTPEPSAPEMTAAPEEELTAAPDVAPVAEVLRVVAPVEVAPVVDVVPVVDVSEMAPVPAAAPVRPAAESLADAGPVSSTGSALDEPEIDPMFFADDVAVAAPAPPVNDRVAWVELIASLRHDIQRMKSERQHAHRQSAPAEPMLAQAPARESSPMSVTTPQAPTAPASIRQIVVPKRKAAKPAQDQWGLFDPEQCGFAALRAKLDEIGTREEVSA